VNDDAAQDPVVVMPKATSAGRRSAAGDVAAATSPFRVVIEHDDGARSTRWPGALEPADPARWNGAISRPSMPLPGSVSTTPLR
jgi:hypothetical protein